PEMIEVAIDCVLLPQPQPFEHGQIAGQPDGNRGEDDAEGDGEAELDARQFQCRQSEHVIAPCASPSLAASSTIDNLCMRVKATAGLGRGSTDCIAVFTSDDG